MSRAAVFRLLFILYCVEVGVFLVLVPWSANWDRALIQLPTAWLRGLLLHSAFRGAITGFGLIHLIWGAHDLETLLARWKLGGRPG
ncbi:MAG: hypothetical protein R3325_06275 [Thermoanaerobaculia bacterium]|nr:hypothetical protein [Thermoanaerobaculia bacterium]